MPEDVNVEIAEALLLAIVVAYGLITILTFPRL